MTSAAILAGGRARRFGGTDKTQVRVDGVTMLDRQLAVLSGVVEEILLVGYRGGATVPPHVRRVADRLEDHGPMGGLDAAFNATDAGAILLLACDMPGLTAAFLTYLVTRAHEADIVLPRTEHGYHPLCAVYSRTCQPAVRRHLDDGRLRMAGLLDDVGVRVVDLRNVAAFGESRHLLANINTQAELDTLDSQLSH